jgi:hypothetical protein
MIKLNLLCFIVSTILFSCAQNNSKRICQAKENDYDSISISNNLFDTNSIAILKVDTAYYWLFKDAIDVDLTNSNIQMVDKLLNECIKKHNDQQDSTKKFYEFIDLKKYKRQYIPFINSKGEKKVHVNCFCISDWNLNGWKKSLVLVDDGGSCFFNVTINLTTNKYEELYINGYA